MKKTLISIALFFVFTISQLIGISAMAAGDYGLNETVKIGNVKAITQKSDLQSSVGSLVGYALSFVGTIFFLLVVYGGFKWMTANGNDKEVGAAKDLIVQAVIGLIVIFSAYILTTFIGRTVMN